jgi:hypothetical protein
VSGPFEYSIWFLAAPLEVVVVVCAIVKHSFRRYFFLNFYMAASFLVTVGRFQILNHFGLQSREYGYFYFYSDSLLTICLYFALISLYAHVLEEMKAESYVRFAAVLLLIGTAIFSYTVVQQSTQKMFTHFFFELSQNLYFIGLVLTYLLWAAILKLRETRTRLVQLVLSLGVFFSASAATYALRNLYPDLQFVWAYMEPISDCLLPLAWAYAFWHLPENARLAPARLAVTVR